ncbi:heavy metal-binding domain-containing protein [Planktomarina temperata]|nr:heavy metal-binding domain-containing protein [Planktomarina temperata]
MAECKECGKTMGFADKVNAKSFDGKCVGCTKAIRDNSGESGENHQAYKVQVAADLQTEAAIEAIVLTTETAPNLNITKRIEIVTAECAFGMNIFKDLFAGVRNVVGGRSEAVQKTMRDSRRTALYELKKEAYEVGANAVVGVDLDYVELAGTGSSMVMLVASGTAVVIEEQMIGS